MTRVRSETFRGDTNVRRLQSLLKQTQILSPSVPVELLNIKSNNIYC